MIFRMIRLFSNLPKKGYPLTIESHFEVINTSKYSPETLPGIIKVFYHLYSDSKIHHVIINWNSNTIIKYSMNSMIPYLPAIENRFINSLILSLGLMGIGPHPIWNQLEPLFVKSSHKEVEDTYVPNMITSFSICKCQNPTLWNILNVKMMQSYLKTQKLTFFTAAIAYKSLMLVRQGSPELLALLKKEIINNIHEMKPPLISVLINAMSYNKQLDQDLMKPIIVKLLEEIDLIEVSELSKILGNLKLLVYDQKICEMIESKILKKIEDLPLKDIVGCFSIYSQKRSHYLDFPRNLFAHYMKNRNSFKFKIENKETMTAYDIKMLGSAIEMNIVVPDRFFCEVFGDIKKNKSYIGDSKNIQANYANIEKYNSFHKFRI